MKQKPVLEENYILDKPRILLLLKNRANLNLIIKHLPDNYTVVDSDIDLIDREELDICVMDLPYFNYAKDKILTKKEANPASFFPVVLLCEPDQKIHQSDIIWKYVDDVLQVPVPVRVFNTRLSTQLQKRQYSLDLDKKQRELLLYLEAINATPTGIVLADALTEDLPLVFVNNGFLNITGYGREEVLMRNCRFLQGEDVDVAAKEEIKSIIAKEITGKRLFKNYRKDGSLFWNELSIAPIKNKDNVTTHYVGIQNDVTDIIEVQKALKESLDEKVVLLQEIHHRVKNNLAIVSGLLWLEMNELKGTDQELPLTRSINRIQSMGKVHELMYNSANLSNVEASKYIRELTETILTNMSEGKTIDLVFELDKVDMNINEVVPLGLLLNELITNSLKYAFKEDDGEIKITLHEVENQFHVSYQDSGKGFKKEFDVKSADTLGMQIITVLLDQLQAKFTLVTMGRFQLDFSFGKREKGPHSNMKK